MATPTFSSSKISWWALVNSSVFFNFEGAGFICYGNITEFDFKYWVNQTGETPYLFGETDFTVGFADPMFSIWCATVVELRLQQMGDIYEKPHFTKENFKFREAVKWGLKFFAPNYQNHTLRQIWSNKSFGVCGSDVVLTLYGGEKKVYARIAIENSMSSITLCLYRAVVMV